MAKNKKGNNNGEEQSKEANNNGGGGDAITITLKLNLHCDACRNRIRKSILSFHGVREMKFEGEEKVKITAWKGIDVVKLRERVEKKTGKKVEIVSPLPPKKDDNQKNQNNNNNKSNKNGAQNDKPKEKEKDGGGSDAGGKPEKTCKTCNCRADHAVAGSVHTDGFQVHAVDPNRFYSPTLFSDENANGCSVM